MYTIKIENTVPKAIFNEETNELVDRDPAEVSAEEEALKSSKISEVNQLISDYKQKQQLQLQNGGPGPVADFEIMKIVNEHNSEFTVEFK